MAYNNLPGIPHYIRSEKNDKEILALFLHLIYDGTSAIMALDDGRFF